MPTLLPAFLLSLIFTLTLAQTIKLPLVQNVATVNHTLARNEKVTFAIDLPATDDTLRLEWSTTDITAFPSTLFFLSDTLDDPIRTSGFSKEHNSPANESYSCSVNRPCANIQTIDWMAFFTRAKRSFLRFQLNQTTPQTVYVTIYNYDIGDADNIIDSISSPPSPETLTGVLSARLETESARDCPGGIFPSDPVCNDNGECKGKRCQCRDTFVDTACDQKVVRLPAAKKAPNETFLEPLTLDSLDPESYTARIDLFSRAVFSATHKDGDEKVIFSIRTLRGYMNTSEEEASVKAPQIALFFSPAGSEGPFESFNATATTLGRNYTAFTSINRPIRSTPNEAGDIIYLVVYAFPRDEKMVEGYALVNINVTTCHASECDDAARGNAFELAIVPAFLVTTAVASIGILLMLYLDRRHRFTSSVDRLSPDEIERMYPAAEFSGETYECPICLCEMENRDVVRKLKCGHLYHSECLDPWLTGNRASCPTCRTDVRIENLSDKRSMRRIVRLFLAPITALRRYQERRRGREPEEDPPDVEPGNVSPSNAVEPINHNIDNNGERENVVNAAS